MDETTEVQDLSQDLYNRLREVLDTFSIGHALPVPLAVGVLTMLAHRISLEAFDEAEEELLEDGYFDDDEEGDDE